MLIWKRSRSATNSSIHDRCFTHLSVIIDIFHYLQLPDV